MVQEKQGVPRLGGVGDQLVAPLPGNHGDLVRELRLRAAGPAPSSLCAKAVGSPRPPQPLPPRGPGGGAPAGLLSSQPWGGPGGGGWRRGWGDRVWSAGQSIYRAEVSGRGKHLHRAGRTSSSTTLRPSPLPRLGPMEMHTHEGEGYALSMHLGPGLHPGRPPLSAWGAAYHMSWAQVGVVAAQARVGEGDTQISNLGWKRGE